MALQCQTTNPISDFGALVRRQLWSILLPFAFVSAVGVMVAELMPRRYDVSTKIKVPEGVGEIQRDVNSAKNDMVAEPLVRSVIEAQEWPDFIGLPEEEKRDYVKRLTKNILPRVEGAGKSSGGSNFVIVLYSDSEGSRAERFLNSLRDRYIENVVKGARADAKEKLETYKKLRDDNRATYQQAEKAKTDLVKDKNLSVALPSAGNAQSRTEDPIQARLAQSKMQLANAEQSLVEERARLEVQEHLKALEPDQVPESSIPAIANAASAKGSVADDLAKQIRELELGILEKREKLKDYRPPASAYQRIEDGIAKDQARIDMLKGESAPSATNTGQQRFVPNPQIAVYDQELSAAKTSIAGLEVTVSSLKTAITELTRENTARQDWYLQLSYLDREVQTANTNFELADQAYQAQSTRVALLEGPLANPFDVVEIAKASDIPSAPNVPIFILISAFLGLAIGFGSALTSEFLRNGFRGIPDLTRGLAVPVLGAVNLITTRAQARRRRTRHIMIATSSAIIVGSVLWITWAYQHDSLRLLGPRLTKLIDDVRLAFRQ